MQLPPIKSFGRQADHITVKGWGRYDDKDTLELVPRLGGIFGGGFEACTRLRHSCSCTSPTLSRTLMHSLSHPHFLTHTPSLTHFLSHDHPLSHSRAYPLTITLSFLSHILRP